jgi:TRAP transporter TAXI family solute receptor
MKTKVFWVAIAVLTFLMIWCTTASAKDLPKVLIIGDGPVGAMDHMLATAISAVLSNRLSMRTEVRAFVGPSAWYPLIDKGEIDLGITNPIDAQRAYVGSFEYKEQTGGKGFRVRLLALGPEAYLAMMVRSDSPVKKVADLRGKRVSWGFGGHIAAKVDTEALLANGGITMDEVIKVPVADPVAGVKALVEGRVDATMVSLTMGVVREADFSVGVRFLPVDPSPTSVRKMQEIFPGSYAIEVVPGSPGSGVLKTKQYCLGFRKPVVCSETLNDKTVYLITRTLYEHYKDLWPYDPQLKLWDPNKMAGLDATLPYHSGAVKFYKEAGLWTTEIANLQNKLLKFKK